MDNMKKKIIRAPNKFRVTYKFAIENGKIESVSCDLYDRSKKTITPIGYVELERRTNNTFVTHSGLDIEYRNRGLGTLLYSKAIAWAHNNGFKVRSSGNSSELASLVWKSRGLRKHFRIRRYIRNEYGRDAETWYAYRKDK